MGLTRRIIISKPNSTAIAYGASAGIALANRFDNAEQYSADHRAGDRTDTADNRRDERFDTGHRAHRYGNVGGFHKHEHAGYARKRGTDCESNRDYLVYADSNELRRASVFGDGKHRFAVFVLSIKSVSATIIAAATTSVIIVATSILSAPI